jgi:hypothetical protein
MDFIKRYWFGGILTIIVCCFLLLFVLLIISPKQDAKNRGFVKCTQDMISSLSYCDRKIWCSIKAISSNTTDCIRSGIMFGNACMLDGMIDKFYEELGKECKIIATGGLANLVTKNCRHEIIVDENIILDGLLSIYNKNKK